MTHHLFDWAHSQRCSVHAPRRFLPTRFVLGIVSTILWVIPVAGSETQIRFMETYRNGSPSPFVDESPAGPVPVASVENSAGYTGHAVYNGTASFAIEDFTTLKTRASFMITNSSPDIPPIWDSVTAFARAEASLVTFGFVQGSTDGHTEGFIQLDWVVDGATTVLADPDAGVTTSADSLTTFTETTTMTQLLSEFHSGTDAEQTFPASSVPIPVFVPWQAGQQVPVEYVLSSHVSIDATNNELNPEGFTAKAISAFDNSATLMSTVVLDSNMDPIPTASFVIVPEPSSVWLLGLVGGTALIAQVLWQRIRRKRELQRATSPARS